MTENKKPSKSKSENKVSFTRAVEEDKSRPSEGSLNSNLVTEGLKKLMGYGADIPTLEQMAKAQMSPEEGGTSLPYRQSKVTFTSNYNNFNRGNDHLNKDPRRLTDQQLKDLVSIDPHIGAIINTRVAQATAIGDPSESKFDRGHRVKALKALKRKHFKTDEEYENEVAIQQSQMEAIQRWIGSCGTDDKEILNEIFKETDLDFKYCNLKSFIQSQVRNLLSFGRMATQIIRNDEGTPVAFRPVPVETIKPVKPHERVFIGKSSGVIKQSLDDAEKYNELPPDVRPAAWVQEIDGHQVAFFTEENLRVDYYQSQAFIDMNGYPLAPIEFALFLVYIHQQTLTYMKNSFTKGILSKAMLVLNSTDPSVTISQEDLEAFKQELTNFSARTDNSASIPVIAGPITAQLVPFYQGSRDMEWLAVEQLVQRALCSAFQINPNEVGFGNLGDQQSFSQQNKDFELVQGEERGLRIVIDVVFDCLNAMVIDNFPEAKNKYRLSYMGVGSETREGALTRAQQEMQTTGTYNTLLSDSEKNEVLEYGGNVPLSNTFHANVVKYMHYGKMLETFFDEKGASEDPRYDFLIDSNLNQAYQFAKAQASGQVPPGQPEQQAPQNSPPVGEPEYGPDEEGNEEELEFLAPDEENQSADAQENSSLKSLYLSKAESMQKSFLAEWLRIHEKN